MSIQSAKEKRWLVHSMFLMDDADKNRRVPYP